LQVYTWRWKSLNTIVDILEIFSFDEGLKLISKLTVVNWLQIVCLNCFTET